MNKKYKVKDIFIVKLAKVTEIQEPGLFTKGYTHGKRYPNYYFATKTRTKIEEFGCVKKVGAFKLVCNNSIVLENPNDTHNIGEYCVYEQEPLAFRQDIVSGKVKIDRKALAELEKDINREISTAKRIFR